MAVLMTLFRCPTCKTLHKSQKDALACKNRHLIIREQWAVGRDGKAVRVMPGVHPDGLYGLKWALREADLSDFVDTRRKQLEKEKWGLKHDYPSG